MADATAAPKAKTHTARLERPDEEQYKKELEKAEKELAAAKARYVSCPIFYIIGSPCPI
jgi:hypothetical protein